MTALPCYRPALLRVHHDGSCGHGDARAHGIQATLRPVCERGGLVLELGCGSAAPTRHLVVASHRVIANDASPAMLALVGEAVSHKRLVVHIARDPMASRCRSESRAERSARNAVGWSGLFDRPGGEPVRSLRYFAGLLEEVCTESFPPSYWRHVEFSLRRCERLWQNRPVEGTGSPRPKHR